MEAKHLRIADGSRPALPTRRQLTEAMVAGLKCPVGKTRIRIHDTKQDGLVVSVRQSGQRGYYLYRRLKGKRTPVEYHLGNHPAMTLASARKLAAQASVEVDKGNNPSEARRRAREAENASVSLQELWEAYRDGFLSAGRNSTLVTDKSRWKSHLESWARGRRANSVTTDDIAALHRRLTATKTPNAADKAVKLLRRMFTWAKVNPNPASNAVTFHGDNKPMRFLGEDEVGRLFKAMDAAPNQTIADAIRFALYTGARRGNVLAARWDQMHLGQAIWIIPHSLSKSGEPMTIPLSTAAVELLKARPREKDSPWVFPGHLIGQPLKSISKAWEDIREAAKIHDFRFHDLRHTTASWMAQAGASLLVIGKQLGHASHQSTERYSHLLTESVRPSLEAAQLRMSQAAKKAGKQ